MNYIKDNLPIISKLILNQFGAAILGLSVSAVAPTGRPALFVFVSLFSIVFYLSLIYSAMWEEGGKERIRIDGGRADMKPLRGLWVALIANIPNILLGILIIFGKVFGSVSGPFAWGWAAGIYGVANTIGRLYQAMYLGVIQTFMPNNPLAFLLIITPAVAVAAGAYAIGIHNKRLLVMLGIKSKKK